MTLSPDDADVPVFRAYNQVNRPFVIAASLAAAILGIAFFAGSLSRLDRFGPDVIVLATLGAAFCIFAWLFWRFAMRPRFEVGTSALQIGTFFGRRKYRYDQIRALGVVYRTVRPKAYGPHGTASTLPMEITIPLLLVRTVDGTLHEHAAPGFTGNAAWLDPLQRRCGKEAIVVEDNELAIAEFARETHNA
ncbi:MAG: hypothetical protein KDA61_03960 [Planctomycetales bacterium]|nr:hypothetical protein [Planctomycetales bacterium]